MHISSSLTLLNSSTHKRLQCSQCLRPQRTCICQWRTPTPSTVELLILQHPLEVTNAKGTAQLLHLCLPNSQLMIGEQFDESTLQNLLAMPWTDDQFISDVNDVNDGTDAPQPYPILLYPQTEWQTDAVAEVSSNEKNVSDISTIAEPTFCSRLGEKTEQDRRYRLIVLDGTWRKSRKMLALNPLLQKLPRLALHNPPPSHYTIRKAHRPEQLSTFEASCLALMQLENDYQKYQPLLNVFDGFVKQQESYVSAGRDNKK